MRKILLHYHIFKNAGVTIDSVLSKQFGAVGNIEGTHPWDTLVPGQIFQYVLNHPDLKAISTHQGRFPLPFHQDIIFFPVVFLRHPIDRVGSVYSFVRRQTHIDNILSFKIAREKGIVEYVKRLLADKDTEGAAIKNFQTIFLSGRERDMRVAVAGPDDLEIARNRLRQLDFFGVVELFKKSMQKMEKYLSKDFQNFTGSYVVQHKSPERMDSLEERLKELKDELGPALYNELVDKNSLDIELYEFALNLFAKNQTKTAHTLLGFCKQNTFS